MISEVQIIECSCPIHKHSFINPREVVRNFREDYWNAPVDSSRAETDDSPLLESARDIVPSEAAGIAEKYLSYSNKITR